ncbi:26S proteasome non-ATPase regulatory subunit 6 [Coelomomyces lativittatus]|nr:26S proteasome non-ATPase regulatory subunit 6 [Coelomomyces lativittatus]
MEGLLKANVYLNPHYRFYVREMRVKAYAQLLESYRSLTLEYMATAFGVTPEFMDQDLYRFISNGRLNCVIDKVRGIVETNRPDNKNAQYQSLIKQGDLLLNRIQKLDKLWFKIQVAIVPGIQQALIFAQRFEHELPHFILPHPYDVEVTFLQYVSS